MATANVNYTTALAAVLADYPELSTIVTTLDNIAAKGRTVWNLELQTAEHLTLVLDHLNTTLSGMNYVIQSIFLTVSVSWVAPAAVVAE